MKAKKTLLTMQQAWTFIFEKKIAMIIAGILLLFFLWAFLKAMLIMAFFIILGTASMLYNRFLKVSLGIELIMLGLVITGLLYGPIPAIIVGSAAFFLSSLLNGHLQYASFVSFIAIVVVSFLIPFLSDMSITTLGITLILVYDAIITVGYLALGSNPVRTALFVLTHISFNVWVFAVIAPRMFNFLQ